MQNEPQVSFDSDCNAFANTTQFSHCSTVHISYWRLCCAKQERARQANSLDRLRQYSRFESVDISSYIRKFRQCFFTPFNKYILTNGEKNSTQFHETILVLQSELPNQSKLNRNGFDLWIWNHFAAFVKFDYVSRIHHSSLQYVLRLTEYCCSVTSEWLFCGDVVA
jgi:hypothetical protein